MDPVLRNLGSGSLSPLSVATYRSRLGMLTSATGLGLEESLADVPRSYKALPKAYPSVATRLGISIAVVAAFRHSPELREAAPAAAEEWGVRRRSLTQLDRARRDNNRLTPAMRKKLVTLAEVRAAAAKLKRAGLRSLRDSQEHLLLRMMVDVPPKRNDLGALRVLKARPTAKRPGNYVLPKDGVLVLTEYKTAKAYGPLTETLPDGVADDLRASLAAFPRKHVFVGKDGGPMTEGAYSEFVKAVFVRHTGKRAGVNALRHAYITESCDPRTTTMQELKDIAKSMGHSVGMQAQYQLVGGARMPA